MSLDSRKTRLQLMTANIMKKYKNDIVFIAKRLVQIKVDQWRKLDVDK